ncbi:MAG: hypothetical protein QOF56_3224 [Acidobacteriaceae bacterium]|nr:hypothetical protein [Acidobacteriaceae bacterium]
MRKAMFVVTKDCVFGTRIASGHLVYPAQDVLQLSGEDLLFPVVL